MLKMKFISQLFLFVGLGIAVTGCNNSSSNKSEQINEIRKAFAEYESLLNSGNYEKLLNFYADDPRFLFMEDGQVKYSSSNEIKNALDQLAQFGPGNFEYEEPDIILLCSGVAMLSTTFKTTFGKVGKGGFSFSGALTATLIKSDLGWQFLVGHSSTLRKREY